MDSFSAHSTNSGKLCPGKKEDCGMSHTLHFDLLDYSSAAMMLVCFGGTQLSYMQIYRAKMP